MINLNHKCINNTQTLMYYKDICYIATINIQDNSQDRIYL